MCAILFFLSSTFLFSIYLYFLFGIVLENFFVADLVHVKDNWLVVKQLFELRGFKFRHYYFILIYVIVKSYLLAAWIIYYRSLLVRIFPT